MKCELLSGVREREAVGPSTVWAMEGLCLHGKEILLCGFALYKVLPL
jgi:hypothetical protein